MTGHQCLCALVERWKQEGATLTVVDDKLQVVNIETPNKQLYHNRQQQHRHQPTNQPSYQPKTAAMHSSPTTTRLPEPRINNSYQFNSHHHNNNRYQTPQFQPQLHNNSSFINFCDYNHNDYTNNYWPLEDNSSQYYQPTRATPLSENHYYTNINPPATGNNRGYYRNRQNRYYPY